MQRGWMQTHAQGRMAPPSAEDLTQLIDGRSYADGAEFGTSPLGYTMIDYRDILTDSRANINVTAQYLAECMEYARKASCTGMELLTHAAACYNGRPDEAGKREDDVESGIVLKYRRAMERMMLDAALGEQLMRDGVARDEILQVMQPAREANALMFAFGKQYDKNKATLALDGGFQRFTMDRFVDATTLESLPETAQNAWQDHVSGKHNWQVPATLGLRWWLVNGGVELFLRNPSNAQWRLER